MTPENLDSLIKLVGNLGFPIFVAVYLLTRVERAIKLLSENLEEMRHVIANCGAPPRPRGREGAN